MVCQACGCSVMDEVRFCTKCGAQVSGAPVAGAVSGAGVGYAPPMYAVPPAMRMARAPRVERNLQTLGILWCIYGGFRLFGGIAGMFFLHGFSRGRWGSGHWGDGMPFGPDFGGHLFGALLPVLAVVTVVATALALATGVSLLLRKPWGRTLAIVAAILALLKPLLGTGLGIYTLWVLAPSQSGLEYDEIAEG